MAQLRRSTKRILVTHTGSLPRPPALVALVQARARGQDVDEFAFADELSAAVTNAVRRQRASGVDVVGDGEMSKPSYATYVAERLTGFEGPPGHLPPPADLVDFPGYATRLSGDPALHALALPSCTGNITYRGSEALERDLSNLRAALADSPALDAFVTAASPGVVALFLENRHYATHERYVTALADAMKQEYEAIHRAGFLLQVDCPDLAMGRHMHFAHAPLKEFRMNARLHVEALNHALANIPAERLRLHLCWGNYEGPHHHDVPLADVVDILLDARPAALSLPAANPRHEHEWRLWTTVRLPDDKILLPGVIDSTSNFIEHPELVAERIVRFAKLLGRENVMASTDCGLATFAGFSTWNLRSRGRSLKPWPRGRGSPASGCGGPR